jgi:hypothetical protein
VTKTRTCAASVAAHGQCGQRLRWLSAQRSKVDDELQKEADNELQKAVEVRIVGAVLFEEPMIPIETVWLWLSFGAVFIKLWRSAKMVAHRTQVGLFGVVQVWKWSMRCGFLSLNSHSKTSACIISFISII